MQRFELTILGCGSALPTNKRNPSAQLLNVAERFFLIDCGEGTQVQLRKYKAGFSRIDHIFISHLHGDHFFGLIGLLQSFHLLGRKKSLGIYGPPQLKEIIQLLNKATGTELQYPVEFITTDPQNTVLLFEDNKVEVISFPLRHKLDCTGFLFREKPLPRKIIKEKLKQFNISTEQIHRLRAGFDVEDDNGNIVPAAELTLPGPLPRSYAYCSDTAYDEKIAEIIRDVSLLYHESTFLEDMQERAKSTLHSTAKEAAQIAKLANAQQLILGHFSSRYDDETLFLEEALPVFSNTLLASDGKVFTL
jgi:ribonuclease Z